MWKLINVLAVVAVLVWMGALGADVVQAQEAGAEEPAEAEADEAPAEYEVDDVIVVTASRVEQRLQEVPAAMTVIGSEELETIPADDFGDVLRNVPGLNISQISARDVQISSRSASGSLATDQLVLLDGRSVYLDFFGFVMWDLLPVDFSEIKQIEVLRGPASAVWGANALGGVVNLITKTPKDLEGTGIRLGGGELGTIFGSVTHAVAADDRGFKISASYYEQDPYDRPTGVIPGTQSPANPGGTFYPPFQNSGTEQPKVDVRYDFDPNPESTWSFAAGYSGTDGIIHSGIGPFDIESGTNITFGKATYQRRALRVTFFANLLDGSAENLLTEGLDGLPLNFEFKSDTFNLDFADTRVVGGDRNILTYGATARTTDFNLSIAPGEDRRDEWGIFLQDEILIGDKWRWLLGGRYDDIDPIEGVFSPRTSLSFAPSPNHTFRISYNQAFRAPSLVENFLDTAIVNTVVFPNVPVAPGVFIDIPYMFPTLSLGNPLLTEEKLTAWEFGYVGTFNRNRTTFTLAAYENELEDATDFFQAGAYSAANPPPFFPLPPFLLDVPPAFGGLQGLLPSFFTYRNIGEITNRGVEISLDHRPSFAWSWFFNYSYQDDPEAVGISVTEINSPPQNRANAGVAYSGERFFADANINYVDDARWTDVLDSRFHGTTDSYTIVNLTLGTRLHDDRVTLSIIGNNIFDEDAQQHVFGDIISRKISGQLAWRF